MNKSEENDFAYLLELMPVLHDTPEYAWLPELFSIIGEDNLITLCKYAGGETIRIPTVEELSLSVKALQTFYNKDIKQLDVIVSPDIQHLYDIIKLHFNSQDSH